MKNPKFKPRKPTQKDIDEFHFIKITLANPDSGLTVTCPQCGRKMKKLDSLHLICDYDHRNGLSSPNHYKQCRPEPIDLIEKYQLNFSEGCFVKYMLRCEFKRDKLGDLKKALYYLNRSKEICYKRFISYAEIREYYDCKKFSEQHLNCLIWFISGHGFQTIRKYLENEICKLDKEKDGN